nr:restriction endonuclease subunit S [Lactobacillus delbrueckii]
MGDVADRVTTKNKGMVSELPLTISAQDGLISQDEFFNKKVASKDLSSYLLLHHGDFAYNKSYSNGYPFGTIKRLEKYPQGVVSSLYIAFKPNSSISSDFMAQYYESNNWHKEIYKCAAEGARNHGLLNIPPSDFFATNLNIPITKSEQLKIGRLLNAVDHTFTLHEEKKCLLERLKSALSQEMFANKNGYPAVRFEGFDKAWKQSKLGEITKVIAAKPYISTPSTHGNYLVIQQGDKPIAGFSNSNPFKNYNNITLFGDHTLSLFKPRSPFLVASDGIKILSPSIEMNGLFYFYELEKYKPKSEGYKRHFTILKKCKANFPTDIDEQKLIGSLLLRIDNLITKQQLKMDKLNETKESLLQNMFI